MQKFNWSDEEFEKLKQDFLTDNRCRKIRNLEISRIDSAIIVDGTVNSFFEKQKATIVIRELVDRYCHNFAFSNNLQVEERLYEHHISTISFRKDVES